MTPVSGGSSVRDVLNITLAETEGFEIASLVIEVN